MPAHTLRRDKGVLPPGASFYTLLFAFLTINLSFLMTATHNSTVVLQPMTLGGVRMAVRTLARAAACPDAASAMPELAVAADAFVAPLLVSPSRKQLAPLVAAALARAAATAKCHDTKPFSVGFMPRTGSASARTVIPVEESVVRGGGLTYTGKFLTISTDEYIGWQIRHGGWWEPETIAKMMSFYDVRPNKTKVNLVEMGTNLGALMIPLALHILPAGGELYGFEPQPAMFANAASNVFLNGLPNVQLFNAALVHQNGMEIAMEINYPDGKAKAKPHDPADATQIQNYGGRHVGSGGERVLGVTLDSLDLRDIVLIKVDVQGAEPYALWGARETIKREMPIILYEDVADFKESVQEIILKAMGGTEKVPAEIYKFDILAFCKTLGYVNRTYNGGHDWFLLPPGYSG